MATDAMHRGNRTTEANVQLGMNHRSFRSALAATAALAAFAAACGDPARVPAGTDPAPPATTPSATGIAHPTGADDVVLKMSNEGGFVPAGFFFVNTPALLVSGDGRVFTQGVVPAIFPGPLLPSVMVRSITEDGIQALLAAAQGAGLLAAAPDYSGGDTVADAPNTVVTINAAGGNFVHSAYALGMAGPESPARQKLLDVVTSLSDLAALAGAANLGADQPFVPAIYRLQARAIDPSELTGQDPAPSVVDWPADAGISLAEATTCARVDAAAVGSLFIDAKQNTYFKQGDIVYQLAVGGVVPGDPAC
jgi:hypothetical protein